MELPQDFKAAGLFALRSITLGGLFLNCLFTRTATTTCRAVCRSLSLGEALLTGRSFIEDVHGRGGSSSHHPAIHLTANERSARARDNRWRGTRKFFIFRPSIFDPTALRVSVPRLFREHQVRGN